MSAVVWPGVPAAADVRSQAFYARGLIAFNNRQWNQAYDLFDRAVRADPKDAIALYYRGLAQARRGAMSVAIEDIAHALQLRPALPHAALDLGIAHFDAGQYAAAKEWLQRAYQEGADRPTAALFLGLTLYRSGQDAAALSYLNEAKSDPELRPLAEYYTGVVLWRQGNTPKARDQFTALTREYPQSEVARVAQPYATGTGAAEGKPWSLYGRAGFEYDSNVVIGPDASAVQGQRGISGEGDGRAVIGAGGSYTLADTDLGSLRASYDFSQSIHFKLTEFDLQGHRVRIEASSRPNTFSYGVAATYDFYLLDYRSFYHEVLGTPWFSIREGSSAATQLYYTFRARDFLRSPSDPFRDGLDHAIGVRQYITLGDPARILGFGYQFDSEDTGSRDLGRQFGYDAHQVDIGVSAPILENTRGQLAYLFRLEDYEFPNVLPNRDGANVRRHDAEHQFVAAIEHDITEHIALIGDFIGTINNSNIPNFEYDRYIVSGSVQVKF